MGWEDNMVGLLRVLYSRLDDGDVDGARAMIEMLIEDFSSSPYSLTTSEDLS